MSDLKKKQDESTTAIVRVTRELPINSVADLEKIGALVAQSGAGVPNAAAGFMVAATCHQSGITLFDYLRTYHTIQNRPTMRADAMLAEFRKRGGRYRIVEISDSRAAIHVEFEGEKYDFEFTMQEAEHAGYPFRNGRDGSLKDNWRSSPSDMLWARLTSKTVRRLCPEIVAGIYTPEETQDFIDITPEPTTTEPKRATSAKAAEIMNAIESQRESTVIDVTPESISDAAEPDAPCEIPPFPGDDESTAADEIDYTVCPIPGKKFGVKWTEFSIDHLGTAMNAKHPAMMPGHYQAVSQAANEVSKRGKK